MGQQVVMGAMLQCNQGLAPCTLVVLPANLVDANYVPAANIQDMVPMLNIPTFGMCNSTSNPMVIALTAAALGVHTPAPCIPAIVGPWSPGASNVQLANQPTLDNSSKCNCMWSGQISIQNAGQQTVEVP